MNCCLQLLDLQRRLPTSFQLSAHQRALPDYAADRYLAFMYPPRYFPAHDANSKAAGATRKDPASVSDRTGNAIESAFDPLLPYDPCPPPPEQVLVPWLRAVSPYGMLDHMASVARSGVYWQRWDDMFQPQPWELFPSSPQAMKRSSRKASSPGGTASQFKCAQALAQACRYHLPHRVRYLAWRDLLVLGPMVMDLGISPDEEVE